VGPPMRELYTIATTLGGVSNAVYWRGGGKEDHAVGNDCGGWGNYGISNQHCQGRLGPT